MMASKNGELKSNELRGQLEMISLKKSLAITGVTVGFLLFGYLSTVAFRKLRAV